MMFSLGEVRGARWRWSDENGRAPVKTLKGASG
jgi:hypothetical protein